MFCRVVVTGLAVAGLLAAPAFAQAPTARDAQPSPQIGKPITPPESAKAPADLRNPEDPEAEKAKEAVPKVNRVEPGMAHRGDGQTTLPRECQDCRRILARVLAAQEDGVLIVRDKTKQEIRLQMDTSTMKGQEESRFTGYVEGDRIEAYVKPDGKIHSINLWKPPAGMAGPDDISGG